LEKVVYHGKLGTQGERVERVRAIARAIGEQFGGPTLAAGADRAAQLAKADLLTDMVGEFPELQGVMGGYYARHDGETEEVAFAIEDHYKPRFAGDELPRNPTGVVVALADKLETLLGMFAIGEIPTGDKDPFALRRHALGALRMCMERNLSFSIEELITEAGEAWDSATARAEGEARARQAARGVTTMGSSLILFQESLRAAKEKVRNSRNSLRSFMRDRLAVMLRDQGFGANEVEAVLSVDSLLVAGVPKRLAAVRSFGALPESSSLASANKRIGNILKKSDAQPAAVVDSQRLIEPAEQALHSALKQVQPLADSLFDKGDYSASLQALAALKAPVDAFFDTVMVNADDLALRANRLGLLAQLHAAMNRVADLSKLAT
jgi:glycyl-tRNA synthetase beta chain